MSAPFTPAGEWVDACGFRRCTVSVDPADGMYPAMVVLDEVELDGSMLPPCARELAALLIAAADEAELQAAPDSSKDLGLGEDNKP